MQDVFAVNDRVRAAVIGIDQEAKQLSLSTAELELEPGAMLRDKVCQPCSVLHWFKSKSASNRQCGRKTGQSQDRDFHCKLIFIPNDLYSGSSLRQQADLAIV